LDLRAAGLRARLAALRFLRRGRLPEDFLRRCALPAEEPLRFAGEERVGALAEARIS
jgi:hypothetical protein